MDYTITFKDNIDTSSIDRLQDKINQLHTGRFSRGSRIGRLHRKINKIHNETQLDDYPNIQKLQDKITQPITLDSFAAKYKLKKTISKPQLLISYKKPKKIEYVKVSQEKVILLVRSLSLLFL